MRPAVKRTGTGGQSRIGYEPLRGETKKARQTRNDKRRTQQQNDKQRAHLYEKRVLMAVYLIDAGLRRPETVAPVKSASRTPRHNAGACV